MKMGKKDLDQPALEGQTPEPNPTPAPEVDVPHGAQCIADFYGAMEMALSVVRDEEARLDNDRVRATFEKLVPKLQAVCREAASAFAEIYTELEPLQSDLVGEEKPRGEGEGEGEPKPEEEPGEKKPDEKKPDEEKGVRLAGHKSLFKRQVPTGYGVKVLSKGMAGCVKDAAEFLADHSQEENLTRQQKAAVKFHAKALGDLVAEPEKPADDMDGDEKALVLRYVEKMAGRLTGLEQEASAALGTK